VVVSELALSPGQPSAPPELVAYSSDGRLTIELGWGDWVSKLAAVRRVVEHVAGRRDSATAPPRSTEHLAGRLDVRDPSNVVARWAAGGAV
jgi:hypothetical protein